MSISNWDIYCSRLLSSLCLFWIISEANVYLDSIDNTLLVLGYRFFILLTPLLFYIAKQKLTFYAFLLVEFGLFAWYFEYWTIGTVLFSIGIAVSGFMLKYHASHTPAGSAGNKIAINIGSIGSGLIIAFGLGLKTGFALCALVVGCAMVLYLLYYKRQNNCADKYMSHDLDIRNIWSLKGVAWSLVGIVTGVKLISFVSILPQFAILMNNGILPVWFGYLIISNSLFVVLFQSHIMSYVKSSNMRFSISVLSLGMIVITLSPFMHLSEMMGALIWTFILSFVECCISYLDVLSKRDNLLLIKEIFVGVGCALTVFIVRYYGPELGAVLVGVMALIMLGCAACITIICDSKKSHAIIPA